MSKVYKITTLRNVAKTALTTLMKFMSLNPLDHEVNGEFVHCRGCATILFVVLRPLRALAYVFTASCISMELAVSLLACSGIMFEFILR